MRFLGQALMSFVRRPAIAMACMSLAEHATVVCMDVAIIKLKRWEQDIRELGSTITINVPEINN